MSIEEDPTEDLHEVMYRLGRKHGKEKADYVRATDAERENRELRSLFEMQQTRMQEATEAWRAEWPEARSLIMPDLGDLLSWLMVKAGIAPSEEVLHEEDIPADLAQERAMTKESEEILAAAEAEDVRPECCQNFLPPAGGWIHESELRVCPTCGTEWIHVIEESEGCWWERTGFVCGVEAEEPPSLGNIIGYRGVRCTHPDDRGRDCRHCGTYVRGDDNG